MESKSLSLSGLSLRIRVWLSALRYLLGKLLTIGITIFIGVFVTVLIANQPSPRGLEPARSPFETSLESQIQRFITYSVFTGAISRDANGAPDQEQIAALRQRLYEESGLNLPFLPRYLLWTVRALSFNWGELKITYAEAVGFGRNNISEGQDVILEHLPNTLSLVGTAYLITFLLGIPLSLYLARRHGNWLDRAFSALSPISSVPSWVFAILLITIFAVQLRWFPAGGRSSVLGIENSIDHVLDVSWHMVLPVLSIVLGLLFQVVYAWRTFFTIYSEEDYVELAKAKGLPARVLQSQYILRPALPYVMTSFATTLISFWQLTIALEVIFQWPGIGLIYIRDGLPNYWGESMYPGQLMIVIEIVVIFAYVLGLVVFLLDLAYVIVDPRIHLMSQGDTLQGRVKSARRNGLAAIKVWMKRKAPPPPDPFAGPVEPKRFSWKIFFEGVQGWVRTTSSRTRLFAAELSRYPSAVFGLTVIFFMLAGSAYAVLALPYEQVAVDYNEGRVSGRISAPRVAAPGWTNFFRSEPLLSALPLNENSPQAHTTYRTLENGWVEKAVTFDIEYRYSEMPSELILYVESEYTEKIPFISLVWITPDGREINLKSTTVNRSLYYDFEDGIQPPLLIRKNPEWRSWFVSSGAYPTPAHTLLFTVPGMDQPTLQKGSYQLEITSLLFDAGSEVYPELTLLGQVYGLAGTDYWRRDLLIPLLWGMPFALFVGLLGTLLTVLVAMLLPAIGVWYGGWLDDVIQRLTEVNMVLPGLTIAVLAYALFGIDIWIVLGIVVVINSFGSPIKNFRSALLQAKEAPYIEAARSYGAGDLRIITRYLVPRILPVLIPQIVSQVPGFIFLEATLGFFNIKSNYPSWGRIIYEGLSRGAIYGSPFWVLMPIFLLLLTGLAFALLGSALERILNPRMLDQVPEPVATSQSTIWRRRIFAAVALILVLLVSLVPFNGGRTLVKQFEDSIYPPTPSLEERNPPIYLTSLPVSASTPTATPVPPTQQASATLPASTATSVVSAELFPPENFPSTYVLQRGEYPYCVARRFNVDPNELLVLNGLRADREAFIGMVLQIPQSGQPFPSERMLREHPAVYTAVRTEETVHEIACLFGDVYPEDIARANNVSTTSVLTAGQQWIIP